MFNVVLSRRSFAGLILTLVAAVASINASTSDAVAEEGRLPNIVLIMADDLGYAEVGCYGQTKIRTPNIDRLAKEGMRFTQHYSGNPVCAPSRCCLMTGYHCGHAYIRTNRGGFVTEGQEPIPDEVVTLPELLKKQGYATFTVGKWGLGGPDSSGSPNKQGFDHFFGYLCQAHAHNHYPSYLRRNGARVPLKNPDFKAHQKINEPLKALAGYDQYKGQEYAPDLMADEALTMIRRHKDEPFFLYYATTVPHVSVQVPDDSLEPYSNLGWDDKPYLGQAGYLPHPTPRAAYAAMVSRFDRDVGRILDLLKELNLEEDTLVLFTSDNGPTYNGGSDSEFFDSNGPLRGLKGSVFEGGIRIPMIVRWPGKIAPSSVSDLPSAFWDVLPTLMEVTGGEAPEGIDGISFLPTLLGKEGQQKHDELYWELGNHQAVRVGDWKLVRLWNPKTGKPEIMLFDLANDLGETTDQSEKRPELRDKLIRTMNQARTPSKVFPNRFYDNLSSE